MNTQEQKDLLSRVVTRLEAKKAAYANESGCAHDDVIECKCDAIEKGLGIAIDEVKNYIGFLGE